MTLKAPTHLHYSCRGQLCVRFALSRLSGECADIGAKRPLGRAGQCPLVPGPGPFISISSTARSGRPRCQPLTRGPHTMREKGGYHTAEFVHRSRAPLPPTFNSFLNYLGLSQKAQGASSRGKARPSHRLGGVGRGGRFTHRWARCFLTGHRKPTHVRFSHVCEACPAFWEAKGFSLRSN